MAKIWTNLANLVAVRKKVHYPGILWFAPFVVVPAAMFPAPSTITIPETKHNFKWENTLNSIVTQIHLKPDRGNTGENCGKAGTKKENALICVL